MYVHMNGKWTELGLSFTDGVSFDLQNYMSFTLAHLQVKNKTTYQYEKKKSQCTSSDDL